MPWKIRKRSCKQKSTGKTGTHAVVKLDNNKEEQESCHTSEKKAQGAVRARHANESILREFIKRILEQLSD